MTPLNDSVVEGFSAWNGEATQRDGQSMAVDSQVGRAGSDNRNNRGCLEPRGSQFDRKPSSKSGVALLT